MANGVESYATRTSKEAKLVRDQLPQDLQLELLHVQDELAGDPDAHLERTRALGNMLLYWHPEPAFEITYEIDRTNRIIHFVHFAARIGKLKRVFVSYSHEDKKWFDRLQKVLTPLEDQGLARIWDDTKIPVGADWQAEIRKALESSKAAVFLVTQDFLNSRFVREQEIPALLEKANQEGVKIIWVAVEFCTVKDSAIYKFQAANDPEHPLEALDEPQQNKVLVEIYEKIKAALAA